ncbi:hypothetical protein HPB49_007038 [Dermacentor silvarum]|uniref:Uncharacterized protein n=1 Tax=Dermacentor silvarum TaxID=543639 RepID=A0ACB8DBL7_DERSI|nr:hypothetical protein HPB49_007038 [Dermacentor silvarum]
MASVSTDELLIDEVRQRPILYDQRLKTHRDSQLRNDAWLEISGVLKRDGPFPVWKPLQALVLYSLLYHRVHLNLMLITHSQQLKTFTAHFLDSAVESRYDDALDEPAENRALPSDETQNKQICDDGPTASPQAKRGTSKKNKRRDIDELMGTLIENRKCLHQLNSSVGVDADELFLGV